MAYVNAAYARCVTIFSTGGKSGLVSNFTQLHTLTLAARSYALLMENLFPVGIKKSTAGSQD